jgi:hypothetical protein
MGRGPVEFVVVEFPGDRVEPGLAPALWRQVSRGVIHIVDLLFVSKAHDGSVRSVELAELAGYEAYRAYSGVVQAIDGLISPEDVTEVAAELRPGRVAMCVLFEHLWVRQLRDEVAAWGGRVPLVERIPAPVVDAVVEAATPAPVRAFAGVPRS